VFNPRRADGWRFRDNDREVRPLLDFGDMEVGADITRNVLLWNMTPQRMSVRLAIEGPDRDQWYISWHGGTQDITPTDSLRVMIKYVPTRASAGNSAAFTLRDPDSGTLLAQLPLVGRAGSPTPAGYALQFDGVDDYLFFGEQAAAFAREEGTMELWVRIDSTFTTIMSNTRNIPQAPAIPTWAWVRTATRSRWRLEIISAISRWVRDCVSETDAGITWRWAGRWRGAA
jgi:hypothetical protein